MGVFRRAAIDVGTHSVRLLVVQGANGLPGKELLRRQYITRLGEGWRPGLGLNPEAARRTLQALKEFARDLDSLAVRDVRAVATSVVREATDGEAFVVRVLRETGLVLRVIDGLEEAALSFRGVAAGVLRGTAGAAASDLIRLSEEGPQAGSGLAELSVIVADVGGGSTELVLGVVSPSGCSERAESAGAADPGGEEGTVLGHRYRLLAKESLPLGAVRLTEAFLHHDPPTEEEWSSLVGHIREVLAGSAMCCRGDTAHGGANVPAPSPGTGASEARSRLIGVGGTATSLAAIDQQLEAYRREKVHGYRIAARRLQEWVERLRRMPSAERRALAGLQPQRAPVAHAGAAIVAGVAEALEVPFLEVSDWGLLEGLIYS